MLINNPLPRRLRQARKAKGISQKELGIRLGMEPGSASSRMTHYEKGRHSPDFETLKRIAIELEVPVAFFFCESETTAELVCLIDRLNPEDQAVLLEELKHKATSSNL